MPLVHGKVLRGLQLASDDVWDFEESLAPFSSPTSERNNLPDTIPLVSAEQDDPSCTPMKKVDFSETASTIYRSSPFGGANEPKDFILSLIILHLHHYTYLNFILSGIQPAFYVPFLVSNMADHTSTTWNDKFLSADFQGRRGRTGPSRGSGLFRPLIEGGEGGGKRGRRQTFPAWAKDPRGAGPRFTPACRVHRRGELARRRRSPEFPPASKPRASKMMAGYAGREKDAAAALEKVAAHQHES
ncbi:hypothetical protein HDV62DRAFT_114055 [Trichoderma sp. SZMC 28011]